MASFVQLGGSGQSGRARTHYRYFFTGTNNGSVGSNKSFFKSNFNDVLFYFFNGYRWLVDAQYTGAFAWCRTNAARKLRKVVGVAENIVRLPPVFAVHCIIEFGNHIAQRTATVAKRNATIHATGRLLVQLLLIKFVYKFSVVVQSVIYRTLARQCSCKLQKSCGFSHVQLFRISS